MAKKIIGEIIKDEVNRQGLKAEEFGDKINCERENVYKIYKRTNMSVLQLQQISKALDHNFFEDIINNNIEMEDPEIMKEFNNRRAVSQFREIVPLVLEELKRSSMISFGKPMGLPKDIQIPDFILTDYYITFTVGESFLERNPTLSKNQFIQYQIFRNSEIEFEVFVNNFTLQTRPDLNPVQINIKLDYKTKDEWMKIMKFAFELYDYFQKQYRIRL